VKVVSRPRTYADPVDNFGAGYASLISRADLPITRLVIDGAHSRIEDL